MIRMRRHRSKLSKLGYELASTWPMVRVEGGLPAAVLIMFLWDPVDPLNPLSQLHVLKSQISTLYS